MDTSSYWIDSAPLRSFPKLDRNLDVDVIIIGGGLMGITTAYLLKQAGRTVALLERERCAQAETGHTTAHVTAVTDLSREEIAKTFGKDAAKAVWHAGAAAIDQIVTNIRAEDIACGFHWVPGYLHAPLEGKDDKGVEMLQREAAISRELGINAEFTPAVPYFDLPGVTYRNQALFHPRRYLAALAEKIPGNGSYIFEHTDASEVQEEPLSVKSGEYTVRCQHIVMATHNPLMGVAGALGAGLFQTKLALYSTYAIGAKLPRGLLPQASFWDTADPYNYLRVDVGPDFDYAIFGGEDHKTGQESDTTACYQRLEERLLRFVPEAQVDHRWSGQVIDTNDGLPFIGELAKNQFGATGFAGNGMTFGTLGAMMATDAILKRENPWKYLFDPARKKISGGAWTYLKENKDYPYYLLRDWLAPTEGSSLDDLPRGEGKILGLKGKKVAAYRDEDGVVSLCSAVCTHLKCIVGWNDAERTWDCPCHGSRFKPTGEVLSGPAEEPLEKLQRADA